MILGGLSAMHKDAEKYFFYEETVLYMTWFHACRRNMGLKVDLDTLQRLKKYE